MVALLGLDEEAVRAVCAEAAQGQVVEAVNFNAPGQVVIAGHAAAVARAAEAAKARGAKRAVSLPVSAPFHCALMQPAGERLEAQLEKMTFHAPQIPVINNVDVQCYTDPQQIKEALVRQSHSPVRWVETIQAMARMGVMQVLECGPGKVLAPLTKRIEPGMQGVALADAAALEQAILSLG